MIPNEESNNIERALAHQERQIQDLNDVVIRQAKEIEWLKAQIMRMHDKLSAIDDLELGEEKGLSIAEQAARDKPPHY